MALQRVVGRLRSKVAWVVSVVSSVFFVVALGNSQVGLSRG